MSEITGNIKMPFHGEKGDSAYEIAKKHGYEGSEKEWVESLGFIPDKSIGEEKFNEELTRKFSKNTNLINTAFESDGKYERVVMNEYNSVSDYVIPYLLKGENDFTVKIPKIGAGVTTFDDADTTLWSTASANYYLAKIDVSSHVGKKVKIYGRSQTAAYYPLAFCIDKDGNILERYGTEDNTLYGYTYPDDYTGSRVFVSEAIEATLPEEVKYIYIQGAKLTSGGSVVVDAIPNLEISGEGYKASEIYKIMQSPLYGKRLYVDGDSICYGNGYVGGFGKIIADKYNMNLTNTAVGGATISMGALNNISYTTGLDWNNTYYLKLTRFNPFTNKNLQSFAYPITKAQYENGFGVYPTAYKLVNGELVEQEYSSTMPQGTFFVKFSVATYGENTIDMYYRMWADNSWLWEAYNSGFAGVHQSGECQIGTKAHWLSESVEKVDPKADYIIFEGGINDYLGARQLGEITEDMTGVVDTTTVAGGLEYICRILLEKCMGKKVLYVITPKAKDFAYTKNNSMVGKTWTDYHDIIASVLKKYSIPYVDLFNNSAFNTELESYLAYTRNNDGVHPDKDGYELFYVPQIVKMAESI